MILPRGITGFNVPKKAPRPDEKTFVSDCWAAVAPRGRVEDRPQILEGSPTSFLTRVLVLPRHEITVLLNSVYPWVGFCRPLQPGMMRLDFVDPGRVATALTASERYRILEASELDQPATEDMLAELGRGERKQLNYWQGIDQVRVGDLVFNFWD